MIRGDHLLVALTLRSAIDSLIAFSDHQSDAEFPYEKVREAIAALIGTSRDEGPPCDVMKTQEKEAEEWVIFLGRMEARMLHEHRSGK